jgi:transposase
MNDFVLCTRQRRQLERQLRTTRDVRVYQRTLAVLERSRGRSVSEIAKMLLVSRQCVYHWLDVYDESFDPDSLVDVERVGRPRRWSEDCSSWLAAFLKHRPTELGYSSANWTTPLLQHALSRCTGKELSRRTIRRELRHGGFVWKRPRYVLSPDPEREKKTKNSPTNPATAATFGVAC